MKKYLLITQEERNGYVSFSIKLSKLHSLHKSHLLCETHEEIESL